MLLADDWDGDVFLPENDCVAVYCRGRGGRSGAFGQPVFIVYVCFLLVAGIYQRVSGIFQGYGKNVYDDLRDTDSDYGKNGMYICFGARWGDCGDCICLFYRVVGYVGV